MTAQLAQCRLYYHCMSVLTPQVSLSLSLHMFDALSFQLIYIWVIRVPWVFIPDVLHFLRTDERYSFRVCMNLIGGVCCDCWKLDWWQHVTHFSDNWRDWLVFETLLKWCNMSRQRSCAHHLFWKFPCHNLKPVWPGYVQGTLQSL